MHKDGYPTLLPESADPAQSRGVYAPWIDSGILSPLRALTGAVSIAAGSPIFASAPAHFHAGLTEALHPY